MLNARALCELLSKNTDGKLCRQWFLMTRNGTLLAYSHATDMKGLRKRAAIAAMSWQEQEVAWGQAFGEESSNNADSHEARPLTALTVELDSSNLLLREIQPRLLLVLEGGVPPRKRELPPRTTPEGANAKNALSEHNRSGESSLAASVTSLTDSSRTTTAGNVLQVQRRKLEAMIAAITFEFDQTGFQLPKGPTHDFF